MRPIGDNMRELNRQRIADLDQDVWQLVNQLNPKVTELMWDTVKVSCFDQLVDTHNNVNNQAKEEL